MELHNHSLAAARFQFQVDNTRSTFKVHFLGFNSIIIGKYSIIVCVILPIGMPTNRCYSTV